jgi:transcriptional regulator with PAS, ATPase and Fis domain
MVQLGGIDLVVRIADDDSAARAEPCTPHAVSAEPTCELAPVIIRDPAIIQIHRVAERIAVGRISVLLLGETGSGKEVLAEVIHTHSPRRDKPFLRLNCAALPESLLESELFGHERGAFSGAVQSKPGLLESADGGTIFLDEIGEMPLSLQAKLLRVLQERKVLRVGAVKPRAIDVRFISATNRDLKQQVHNGHFRQDLFFRLNGIALTIPPLRQRPSEIEPLAQLFLRSAASDAGLAAPPRIAVDAIERLRGYEWPGNVRELCNVMERALLLCGRGGQITLEHLPPEMLTGNERLTSVDVGPASLALPIDFRRAKAEVVTAFEKTYLRQLLSSAHGNLSLAARLSRKDRSVLNRLVKKHGISADEFRDEPTQRDGLKKGPPS